MIVIQVKIEGALCSESSISNIYRTPYVYLVGSVLAIAEIGYGAIVGGYIVRANWRPGNVIVKRKVYIDQFGFVVCELYLADKQRIILIGRHSESK